MSTAFDKLASSAAKALRGRHARIVGQARFVVDTFLAGAIVQVESSARHSFDLQRFVDNEEMIADNWPFGTRDQRHPFGEMSIGEWCRGRIPRVFGFAPPPSHGLIEATLDVAFLAIARCDAQWQVYPFACYESAGFDDGDFCFGAAMLEFDTLCEDEDLRERIAERFWSLLMEEPADLMTWEDLFYTHSDAAVRRSSQQTDAFVVVENQFAEDVDFNNYACRGNEIGFVTGDWQPCVDCDGTGVEDAFPYTEDCGTCGGTGRITW